MNNVPWAERRPEGGSYSAIVHNLATNQRLLAKELVKLQRHQATPSSTMTMIKALQHNLSVINDQLVRAMREARDQSGG